ncbi:MAG: PIN domain-containing protein [Desulfosarcina sp.]
MRKKVVVDTGVYIELFNRNRYREVLDPFNRVTYLAYPVLHELWMGLKGREEIRALTRWRDRYVTLKRYILPTVETLNRIGEVCLKLKTAGRLDPAMPKHYNDICIAALARQVGAVVLTKNEKDFTLIQCAIDVEFENVDRIDTPIKEEPRR